MFVILNEDFLRCQILPLLLVVFLLHRELWLCRVKKREKLAMLIRGTSRPPRTLETWVCNLSCCEHKICSSFFKIIIIRGIHAGILSFYFLMSLLGGSVQLTYLKSWWPWLRKWIEDMAILKIVSCSYSSLRILCGLVLADLWSYNIGVGPGGFQDALNQSQPSRRNQRKRKTSSRHKLPGLWT